MLFAQEQTATAAPPLSQSSRAKYQRWLVAVGLLLLVYGVPLFHLAEFATQHDLYSHILLIPFVAGYFVWTRRRSVPLANARSLGVASVPLVAGIVLAISWLAWRPAGGPLAEPDSLALMVGSFLSFLIGITIVFLGGAAARALAFPLGFLVFMAPLPASLTTGAETLLQYGSAAVARVLFDVVGTPVLQDDLLFRLSTITLQVAPECSGIHSTFALLISSVVAAHLFLRTSWARAILLFIVAPLALLRNGFRIFTLGELCVHIGPRMIDSPIHHRGGPIFFLLSLIPFVLILRLLIRWETRGRASAKKA